MNLIKPDVEKKQRSRKQSLDLLSMQYGKVPPQAKELEEAILGAIMLERDAMDVATSLLRAETFYVDAHQKIFNAMLRLVKRNSPIDLLTVVEELKTSEELDLVGGPYYVTKLTNAVVSAANLDAHARIVVQKYLSREMIRIGSEIVARGYDDVDDVFRMLDYSEECFSALRFGNIQGGYRKIGDIAFKNVQQIEDLRNRGEMITGVSSEFKDLDMVTCGWQQTDLIILAARPSVGKTAFALALGKNAANSEKKVPVGIFSLEMEDRQLVNRALSTESKVWLWNLKNGKISDEGMRDIYKAAERLDKCPIFIDDTSSITIQDLKAKARMMVKRDKVGLIIIDYLQLVTVPGVSNREQQISTISRELKGLAKELKVPVIALSQLSREIEKRSDPRPLLSDLRESGAIEQDADMVIFLHKPSPFQIEESPDLINVFYLDIAKHRNGASPVRFIGEFNGESQTHTFLKVVDGRMKPLGDNWQPVVTQPVVTQPVLNFYESTKTQTSDGINDAPF